jgi:hypothetical protein
VVAVFLQFWLLMQSGLLAGFLGAFFDR